MLQQSVINNFVKTLGHIEYGSMSIIMPGGKQYDFQGKHEGAHAEMQIHNWRTIPAIADKGDIGLAEAYRDGWWDTSDLTSIFLLGIQNEQALESYIHGNALSRLATRFLYLFTRNTLRGSKRNIHAHYDLGNDFYKLWLDPSMSYSSALFLKDNDSLEQAQYNKYDLMLDRLGTDSGKLLEVGCGWGGLAERATTNYNFDVKGITLSHEQHAYAQQRLGDKAEIVIEDYRKQEGKYNNIISIEMFEAVGEKFWPVYFKKLQSLLEQKGKAVVQTITIGDPFFEQYRKGGDMIRSFIFPGGMLPSPARFVQEAERAGLRVTHSHAFGQDYARTLEHWLAAFDANIEDVKKLGFDEPFIRLWRFYLTYCIASFTMKRTDVMQWELQHA
jgi:cyclopropane-fatty-acyl-phospholipid synthase